MTKKIVSGFVNLLIVLLTAYACGGGGGDAAGNGTPPQPTTATLRILNTGTLASGSQIGEVNVTIVLPSGVTVKATPDTSKPSVLVTNAWVVAASGVAAGTNTDELATYTAATTTVPGKVAIQLANANGFGTGEIAAVICDLSPGSTPKAADFQAVNLNSASHNRLSAGWLWTSGQK